MLCNTVGRKFQDSTPGIFPGEHAWIGGQPPCLQGCRDGRSERRVTEMSTGDAAAAALATQTQRRVQLALGAIVPVDPRPRCVGAWARGRRGCGARAPRRARAPAPSHCTRGGANLRGAGDGHEHV